MNKAKFRQAVINTINEPDMYLMLIRKGVDVGAIHCPVPNEYETRQNIIDKYTNYEESPEYDGEYKNGKRKYKMCYLLVVDNISLRFDNFREDWI